MRVVRATIEGVSALLGAALLLAVVLTVTGQMAWVVTTGTSMEPTFRAGDLAIVRPSPTYEVGDVVAYRNPDLDGQLVLHRVIGVEDGRLLVQGDDNDWVDSHRPTPDEVLGDLRFHLPSLGVSLRRLFSPLTAAVVAFIGTVLALGFALPRPVLDPTTSSG